MPKNIRHVSNVDFHVLHQPLQECVDDAISLSPVFKTNGLARRRFSVRTGQTMIFFDSSQVKRRIGG